MTKEKLCPGCGETDPKKWYGPKSKSKLCKACVSDYNKANYRSIKSQRERIRDSRKRVTGNRCIECRDMSVDKKLSFRTFCQARRLRRKVGGYHVNCGDCGLGKRVDGGFLPVNISIMGAVAGT